MASFPVLTGEAKTGKTKIWSIEVKDSGGSATIISRYGYEDGAQQVEEKEVTEGKNLGKKNETSPLQQAIQMARTSWNKKKASGYVEMDSEAEAVGGAGSGASIAAAKSLEGGRAAAISVEVPMPMLAHKLSEKEKHLVLPCYGQPKFDGTRSVGLCGLEEGTPCLFSRQRKAYPHLEHIQAVLRSLPKGLVLDGELYTTKHKFQKIVGLVKQKTIKEEDREKHNDIQLYCYDIVDAEKTCEERYSLLKGLLLEFKALIGTTLVLCPTVLLNKKEDFKVKHDEYVAAGFEGLMLRNLKGRYAIGERSNDLLKMKEFQDDEYEVVGFYEGEGREAGCVMWRLKTAEGKEFGCRPEGTHEERGEMLKEAASYVGKKLTVRFQELTKDGIPRFPVGVAFRDYE
jgi:DNA ligase 1